MSGLVAITYEGKKSVEKIQQQFKKNLSEKEILKTTARAINETAKKVQGNIRQQIRREFTIKNKYLMKPGYKSYTSKMASGSQNRLYAHIKFSYRPMPMTAFSFTGKPTKKGKQRPVSVEIKKGHRIYLRHATVWERRRKKETDIVTYGIYAHGRYVGKKFVPSTDSHKVTELKTSSPYSMSMGNLMQSKINSYVEKELPIKLQIFLQKKIDKMKRTAV